jgi:hypothetical protein
MLSLERSEGGYIHVKGTGTITAADYRRFNRIFADALSRKQVPVPLLLDLREFGGWTFGGFARDLQFDIRHRRTFSRIAVVGRKRWHRWITHAGAPLFTARLKYFSSDEEERAKAWVGH